MEVLRSPSVQVRDRVIWHGERKEDRVLKERGQNTHNAEALRGRFRFSQKCRSLESDHRSRG